MSDANMPSQTAEDDKALLVVQVMSRRRVVAAAVLLHDVPRAAASKLTWHYRNRAHEIVNMTTIAAAYGDPVPDMEIALGLRTSLERHLASMEPGVRQIEVEPIPGSIERFLGLIDRFPIWTPHDTPTIARTDPVDLLVDPAAMRCDFARIAAADALAYPRCRSLLDFWTPPDLDVDHYRQESDALVRLLTSTLVGTGPSSVYRDAAHHLAAFAGMLCPNDGALRDLVDTAETLVRRFWPAAERARLARRHDVALESLKDARGYVPNRTVWKRMSVLQTEFVEARSACQFPFGDAIVPIIFELDGSMLTCKAELDGPVLSMTPLSATFLGDDDPEGHGARPRPALLPST